MQRLVSKEKRLAIGLMSGTSLDGIDAALVEITGAGPGTEVNLLAFESLSYSNEESQGILNLCNSSDSSVDQICRMNVWLGEKFAEAARRVMEQAEVPLAEVDFISSHGQTIFHMPDHAATLQIGELAVIAEQTGCVTVGDFRPSDMAVGGQGAPLVPFVDDLLFRHPSQGRILINIGGISNLSVLEAGRDDDHVLAFDTGPGNVLIDAIVQKGTNKEKKYDEGGQLAAQGKVDVEWLEHILEADDYLKQPLPKTTGRELYTSDMAEQLWQEGKKRNLRFEDIIATITAYTVEAIARHIHTFVDRAYKTEDVIIAGGGVHNHTLLEGLKRRLSQRVTPLDDLNFSSDAKEAITFALLGNEFLHGQSNNLPSATGASKKAVMGKLVFPSALLKNER
nr:anhydro-N-acetylmuramic acid kinase [Thalassobacillus sp. CUG 92003]